VVVLASLTGCSTSSSGSANQASKPSPSSAAPRAAAELANLWTQFRETVNLPAKPLTTNLGLKAPAGFTQADVDVLARRAITILKRSTAPRLSRLSPDRAVEYVYATQPTETLRDFERDAIETTQGHPWEAMAASRFEVTPSAARVIRVAASVKKYSGTLANGTPAPYLAVVVEAHLVQEVPVHGSQFGGRKTAPIVSYRAVSASSFRPRGGPDFWPAVRARMSPYGNNPCALESTRLVPLTDPDLLRKDLANLKLTLRDREAADTNFSAPNLNRRAKKAAEKEYAAFRGRCDNETR